MASRKKRAGSTVTLSVSISPEEVAILRNRAKHFPSVRILEV